jgi:hypothetical protein
MSSDDVTFILTKAEPEGLKCLPMDKSLMFIIRDLANQIASRLNDSFMRHKAAKYIMSPRHSTIPFEIMS